jgi:hypothetical protein
VQDSVASAVASKKSRREQLGRGGIDKSGNGEGTTNLSEKVLTTA